DAVVLAKRADRLERAPLELGHLREGGFDVGEARSVPLAKAPAARRQAGCDLDHLRDTALGDRLLEQRVERAVPGQQVGLERRTAEPLADDHRRAQRLEQQTALARAELRR